MQASEYLNWGTAFGALKSHLHIFDYIQWSKKGMKIIQNCNKDGKKKKLKRNGLLWKQKAKYLLQTLARQHGLNYAKES